MITECHRIDLTALFLADNLKIPENLPLPLATRVLAAWRQLAPAHGDHLAVLAISVCRCRDVRCCFGEMFRWTVSGHCPNTLMGEPPQSVCQRSRPEASAIAGCATGNFYGQLVSNAPFPAP